MTAKTQAPVKTETNLLNVDRSGLLQRKCDCGKSASLTGQCSECQIQRFTQQPGSIVQTVSAPVLHELIQPKLRVGEPGDKYEQEADHIADEVMRMPEPSMQREMESEEDKEEGMAQREIANQITPLVQRQVLPEMEEAVIQTRTIGNQAAPSAPTQESSEVPSSVHEVLRSPGQPLDPATRAFMEPRFGHDFSRVRVHSDAASEKSARHVNAHAYTSGYDIVFEAGRFAPATVENWRLLAHELTHVVQQTRGGGRSNPAAPIQRDESGFSPIPDPGDLVKMYSAEMQWADHFDRIADRLVLAVSLHPFPNKYIRDVFKAIDSDYEDNLGAAFVKRLPESRLDQFAASSDGRFTLNVLYEAIITGDVSAFEREQANRIFLAKARRYGPEEYALRSKIRPGGLPTRIFPVRFMRVTGGDYAPPLAQLMPNGKVRVKYPTSVLYMPMFKEELQTLGNFFTGQGEELNANEIVGIKDYEKGGGVLYLPALALIDYSNQAIQSTTGKIIEVSAFAATMGIGGGAVAGGSVAATEVRMTAIWAARLVKGASMLDRVANVIGIASFVIDENRDWIISKLGEPGKRLVQISNIANSVAGIYGIGRLAQGGYKIVKDLRAASKAAREQGKKLTQAEAATLQRLDDETDAMLKQLDEESAKSGRAAVPTPAEKPAASGHVDDPAAAKATAKGDTGGPDRTGGKPASSADDVRASAKAYGIPVEKLEAEVADLRRQTANPNNVRQPADPTLDAEMSARGHEFERSKSKRTWCRHSEDADCNLQLGKLNADVDAALPKRQVRHEPTVSRYSKESRANLVELDRKFPKLEEAHVTIRKRGSGPGMRDEKMLTNGGKESYEAKLRSGEGVQLDDITPDGVVIEVKMRTDVELLREKKIEEYLEKNARRELDFETNRHLESNVRQDAERAADRYVDMLHTKDLEDWEDQLVRQHRFIEENLLTGGEWITDSVAAAKEMKKIIAARGLNKIKVTLVK